MTISDHKHDTDRIDGRMVAECPNGCQSWELVIEMSESALDEIDLDELVECSACGAEMDTISQETASEVVE